MNLKLKKSLKQYGAIFEERQNLIPATIGTDDSFGQVDVPGKDNYVYVRIQSGEIAQAYNTKVVALAGLRVWCGYEKTRPGLLQVLDVRNVYGKEYQQKVPAHAKTHEYGGYDQVFIRGEQFIPKLVSKYSGMTVRVQAGAIYTDEFGWYWHRPQEVSLAPYVPVSGAHWALIEISHSGSLTITVGSGVQARELLFENTIPQPHNNHQPVAAVALYANQSGIGASKYAGNDILDLRWYQSIQTGTAGGGGGIPDAPMTGITYGRNSGTWVEVSGSGGGITLITGSLSMDLKIDQTSGTSGYGILKGNQNSSNLFYTVSQNQYMSGRLLVFLNGQALSQGIDWSEQYSVSGTFYFISGSVIPTSTDIITAEYLLTSGSLPVWADAPYTGLQYGRQSGAWTVITGSGGAGITDAPLNGLQYARQSGTWKYVTGSGATKYSQLTDVRISGTMSIGSTPVWIAASGAWYPMPIWEDSKDPTGFINNDNIHMSHNQANNTVYLSGTLDYYWHGIKRTLGDGVTWTSPSHSGTAGLYYLYSSDGINFGWSTVGWTFDLLQVAYSVLVTGTYGYHFGVRECHGLMQWQVHEELHRNISAYRESGGAPVVGSYQLNSDNNAHTRPTFAQAQIHDEDIDTVIPSVTGSYTTLRILTGTFQTAFQTGEDYPFRATGSYILVNNPALGSETAAVTNRYLNVYQIMIPVMADSVSQRYRMVFLQPQTEYTSQALATEEDITNLDLGNFASQFLEAVYYTRLTYYTNASYANIGKVRLVALTYLSRFGAGSAAGGGDAVPATYVLSGTNYNMPASVGTALEYARADHQHGTPPSGTVYYSVEAQIGDGVNVITSGTTGYLEVPVGAVLENYRVVSGLSGTVSIDVMKSTYASAPPTVSICSGTYVTLNNDFKNQDTNLNGWTKTIAGGDWVGFKVLTAPTLVKQVTVSLNCRKL